MSANTYVHPPPSNWGRFVISVFIQKEAFRVKVLVILPLKTCHWRADPSFLTSKLLSKSLGAESIDIISLQYVLNSSGVVSVGWFS